MHRHSVLEGYVILYSNFFLSLVSMTSLKLDVSIIVLFCSLSFHLDLFLGVFPPFLQCSFFKTQPMYTFRPSPVFSHILWLRELLKYGGVWTFKPWKLRYFALCVIFFFFLPP